MTKEKVKNKKKRSAHKLLDAVSDEVISGDLTPVVRVPKNANTIISEEGDQSNIISTNG